MAAPQPVDNNLNGVTRARARGHFGRTGHELRAHYEPTEHEGIYKIIPDCCNEG